MDTARPIVTLTTDFGTSDGYVAAMKGTMLRINPYLHLVDVTHKIAAFDVMEAAFVLRQATPFYPEGTVHLAVIDPGVGSMRHGVALRHQGYYYVGPDNGMFALLLGSSKPETMTILDDLGIYREVQPSRTFHGRDIFAPAAALLASGHPIDRLGSPADALRPLHWALPIDDDQGIRGWIVHVDHFGNCVTNIPQALLQQRVGQRKPKCYVGGEIVHGFSNTYSDVPKGESLLLLNSDGFLEIAINQGNAAELLQVHRGMPVNIVFTDDAKSLEA